MGMYDSVFFKCLNCGEQIEEQSKAGGNYLQRFKSDEVPMEIASDIVDCEIECRCGAKFKITCACAIPITVKMTLTKI